MPKNPNGPMDLWYDEGLHASKYGSYLDALVQFGEITGLSPQSLGAHEQAAMDLGIGVQDAAILQRVAAIEVGVAVVPEPATTTLLFSGLALVGWATRRRTAAR